MRLTQLGMAMALIVGALAPAAHAADLLQVYRDAQQQDPTLAAARATWAATQEALPQARAGLLPSVNLTGNTTYNDANLDIGGDLPANSSRRFNSNGFGVTATQPLFRAQNYVVYKEAKIQVRQADYVLSTAQIDLIQRIAQAYFDVLLAQDNVALAGA